MSLRIQVFALAKYRLRKSLWIYRDYVVALATTDFWRSKLRSNLSPVRGAHGFVRRFIAFRALVLNDKRPHERPFCLGWAEFCE